MNTIGRFAMAILLIAGLLGTHRTNAQTFSGSNAPGTATDFSFSLNAAATNLSVIVPGDGGAFSHLLIRKGSAPTDTDYDFISPLNGQTNALHLEMPELSAGNYFIRVRTPANSLTHAFTEGKDHCHQAGSPHRSVQEIGYRIAKGTKSIS